ncbi:MAG TPA: ATP-dependent sacrificial sulfur transferase LarE [Erysipelotrichaceae bacterium]|nr:ATP-dependent sacrificial sulfur transferase LarE [Erysipelotrichaceae bacterium]
MKLIDFFKEYPRVAIAFSGGVDSTYLLYVAKQCAIEVQAYYVKTAFQPQFELNDALRIANELGTQVKILHLDVVLDERISSNPNNRCYYCKRKLFEAIKKKAEVDGFTVVLDGTNASDDISDRPGTKALHELSVISPLRLCGLTKTEIRQLSRNAGLFTWNKLAYSCLATRISVGEQITEKKLRIIETVENYLFSLGLSNFRVRHMGDAAKIQVSASQIEKIIENRESIIAELKQYYSAVLLDLEVRE